MRLTDIFKAGNNKLTKDTLVLTLPEGVTCKAGLKCREYCFGRKSYTGEKGCRQNMAARMKKLEITKRSDFVDIVNALLKKNNTYKTMRIHDIGDLYSVPYIEKIYAIANANPSITMYLYTKRDDLITKALLDNKPANLIMIFSYDGINADISDRQKYYDLGYNKIAVVIDKTYEGYEDKLSCNKGNLKSGYCGLSCRRCMDNKPEHNVIYLAKH